MSFEFIFHGEAVSWRYLVCVTDSVVKQSADTARLTQQLCSGSSGASLVWPTVYVYTRSPVEIQAATRRNLIGRSMTALLPMSLPSSILPSPSPHCVLIPATRYGTLFKHLLFNFSVFLTWCHWTWCRLGSKGKAIPLQAWTTPEGSKRLRLPDFKTVGTWRW